MFASTTEPLYSIQKFHSMCMYDSFMVLKHSYSISMSAEKWRFFDDSLDLLLQMPLYIYIYVSYTSQEFFNDLKTMDNGLSLANSSSIWKMAFKWTIQCTMIVVSDWADAVIELIRSCARHMHISERKFKTFNSKQRFDNSYFWRQT